MSFDHFSSLRCVRSEKVKFWALDKLRSSLEEFKWWNQCLMLVMSLVEFENHVRIGRNSSYSCIWNIEFLLECAWCMNDV